MGRRRGFISTLNRIAREQERQAAQSRREAVRRQAALVRQAKLEERISRANAKEAAKLKIEGDIQEAAEMTQECEDSISELRAVLSSRLQRKLPINVSDYRKDFIAETFDEKPWQMKAPAPALVQPSPPGFFARILPGTVKAYEDACAAAKADYEEEIETYNEEKAELERKRDVCFSTHLARCHAEEQAALDYNLALEALPSRASDAEPSAIIDYLALVIETGQWPADFIPAAKLAFLADSNHLVVECRLPDFAFIPLNSGFKYVRASQAIVAVAAADKVRRALFNDVIAQIALGILSDIFRSQLPAVDTVTLNGVIETVDPRTGKDVKICVLSVRISRGTYDALDLRRVDAIACLKELRASVSRSPDELLAVKPLLEFDMTDPRFIESGDVLSTLDERPNLMELTPSEFESLITNLFAKMGLDTRQTQASRDGGVDCVAYDPRPIFGGKVVIQAKRYKNTVGVSAVRDLFGTVQNEGASKGILVTTSGYGTASFEFAKGKPLELLDGANLLYLLSNHAQIEAKIIVPDGWLDQPAN